MLAAHACEFVRFGTSCTEVQLLAGAAVPVLAVNVGQLGYLTAVEPDELEHLVDPLHPDAVRRADGPQRVGAIGLGAGVMAAHGRSENLMRMSLKPMSA